jgi:DHA2 family methylenomycin A resistance protein-like MFS transporter
MVIALAALGLGCGLTVPVITSELMGSAERSRSGVAAGTLNTLRQTGSAIGVALFGSLIAGAGQFISGFHVALAIAIGLAIVIVGLTPLMDGRAREA